MSNVLVEKNKIDILANAISDKSGEPVTMTLAEMVEAVDGIETGGGGITPTGNINITQAGVTDVTNYATATVPDNVVIDNGINGSFITINGARKWDATAWFDYSQNGIVEGGINYASKSIRYSAIASGTTVTPTESAQTIGGANTMMEGAVTVEAVPTGSIANTSWLMSRPSGTGKLRITHKQSTTAGYISSGSISNYRELTLETETVTPSTSSQTVTPTDDWHYLDSVTVAAMPSGTAGTPTATKGTVSNHQVSVTPSVTNTAGYISGGTINGTAVSVSASELVSGTYTVDSSGTKDVTNYASASVPAGTAGTPSASKGAVSNHSISVTPSVTNTTGFITGSTKTGTAVTVSASELVSGSDTLTDNGDYDVTNLASVTVNVSGGGGGSLTVGTKTTTLSSASSSIQFTGLSGNPLSFVVTSSADQSTGGTKVVSVAYDGTSLHGMDITTQMENDTGFTKSYSSGTLTITATTATFEANEYKLVYAYGGSSSDIHTADVQVGSGATSITFTGLSGRPAYFSCVFKSTFSTSSGYQRVIDVVNDGTNTYGHAMDSSAKAQTSWSYSYSGSSLTITSSGTNNGGYFHQPGYYQLTYAVDSSAPQYETVSKTYRASTSAQSETITPSSGYDAIEEVGVSIPAVTQTNLTAANIKSGTTISISNGQSNLWSVTGTYEGGGGTSKNVQVLQSTSRTNSSSLTKVLGDLTVSKTGTYDIYWSGGRSNTSTSYTWGTRLYVDGTGYGTENTTWSNNCQSNHLSNVSLTANQKLSVYARGRSGSYYTFAPMLVIIEA